MKLAIINDDLVQNGGQERLLMALSDLYPDADIFTSLASQYWLDYFKKKGRSVHTTFLQNLPYSARLSRYYAPFLLHNLAYEGISLKNYDLALSQSSRFAHHVVTGSGTTHLCYMNSPARMLWEPDIYFKHETFGILQPIKKLGNGFLQLPLSYLRAVDYAAAQRVDHFIANSKATAARIKKYYHRDSRIIYPFVDLSLFKKLTSADKGYFCMAGRLVSWKRVDVAIRACVLLGVRLKIIGSGPDLRRLQRLAGPGVEFLGHISDSEKAEVIANSMALIQTQTEDFGIVPLEAMACGKPVIGFGYGGVLETVVPGITGIFYYEQKPEVLADLLSRFHSKNYNPDDCTKQAARFSREMFMNQIRDWISETYNSSQDIV